MSGTILELIRSGAAATRGDLVEQTGLGRRTIGARLGVLVAQGLIVESPGVLSTGGRPPMVLNFNPGGGVVFAIDIGTSRIALAIADLAGKLLVKRVAPRGIEAGPRDTLAWVRAELDDMLTESGHGRDAVRSIGVGLPALVEPSSGRPRRASRMPGWDGFPVADAIRAQFGVPVVIDNDVNIVLRGEARENDSDETLLVVRAGNEIGLGHMIGGVVQRGAQGCAGDIGHAPTVGYDDVRCACGRSGCLEAVAGGAAIAQQLTAVGIQCRGAAEAAELALSGVPEAIRAVRRAGCAIGSAVAIVINLLNPSRLVVAGDLADAREHLLNPIREAIYRESGTLATFDLDIARARSGELSGLTGATRMALDDALWQATDASWRPL